MSVVMETFEAEDQYPKQSTMRRRCQICAGLLLVALIGAVCGLTLAWKYLAEPEWGSVRSISHPRDDTPPYPGSTLDNLWWFVQISDLHLNEFDGKERYHQFWHFCSSYVDIIQPTLVLVTGDLTDAVHGSKASQNEMEWEMYKKCLEDSGVLKKTLWLDVRGNHDIYNLPSGDSESNFYRKYSYLGKQGETNFAHHQKLSFGTYSFIYVAATALPASKPPFNFFGVLKKADSKSLEALTNQSRASNSTIYFSHYPSSFIVSRASEISTATSFSNGIAFLSGHLHALYGHVNDLKVLQRGGTLELELLDWKDNRQFRVLAFDHDLLSLVDATYGEWPIILITNPKNARFLAPKHEPVTRIRHSKNIRILVFSPNDISSAKVYIDSELLGDAEHVKGPLYALKWDPALYWNGLHTITVEIQDVMGHEASQSQSFSLDGSHPDQSIISAVVLMLDIETVLKVCFATGFVLTYGPLILLRLCTRPTTISFLWIPFAKLPLLRGLLLLVHENALYYIIMVMGLWTIIGPWFIGEMVDGHLGFLCLYGVFVNGSIIPDPIIYREGLYDMLYALVPFVFHLALQLELLFPAGHHHQLSVVKCQSRVFQKVSWWLKFCVSQLLFACALKWLVDYSRFLWSGYGTLAFLLAPKYTWTVAVMVSLYFAVYGLYFRRRRRQSASL